MKKILILLTLLCLTGCNVKYDLTITDKQQVKEKFYVYIENDEIIKSQMSIDEYLDYYSNIYKKNDGYSEYKIITKKSDPNSYFVVKNDYKNLSEYINSTSFKSMFYSASVETVGKYTTFKTSKNAYLESVKNNQLISSNAKYKSFEINIKFYNEVVSSNADKVDEKNNIYTWVVSEDDKEDFISFKIGPKVKYNVVIKDYIQNNIITFAVIGSSLAILATLGGYIYIKSKKNNEI